MLIKIAWHNIWRNTNRSLIIVGSVAIGVWGAIFITAFMWGMSSQRIADAIENELGHIQVHHPMFLNEDKDIQYDIGNGIQLANLYRKDSMP